MKKHTLGLAAATLLAFSVQASDIPYTYGDFEYNSYDNADGFGFGGSYDLQDMFYGFGQYSAIGADNGDVDTNFLQLGGGYRFEHTTKSGLNFDLIAEVSFVSIDIDAGNNSEDDTGFALAGGIRSMVAPNIELFGKIEMVDLFTDSETGVEIGGLYYFGNDFALGATLDTNDRTDGFSIKGRYTF